MRTLGVWRSLRPAQWVKNVLVFAGLVFSGQLREPAAQWASLLTFLSFCAVSSGVYLVNDVLDRAADREHPTKRHRPIAAGIVPVPLALLLAVLLVALGVGGAAIVSASVGELAGGYFLLHLAYSLFLKHVSLVDVLLIAGGFVIRAVSGAVAVGVPISPWLYACTFLLALLLALGKRRSELVALGEQAVNHRRNLAVYSVAFLDRSLLATAVATVGGYTLYTLFSPATHGSPVLVVTVPFVLVGIVRYLRAVHTASGGQSPEILLFTDRWLLASVLLWGGAVLFILYGK